jgi:hypothetical protein
VKAALEPLEQFQSLKMELLDQGVDTVVIGKKRYIKRSGWRKIALAFNLSTEVNKTSVEILIEAKEAEEAS